jgi:hypothetical protein
MEAYECLKEVEECLKSGKGMGSAKDVLKWGRSKGWVGTAKA